jgi:hypothetical protein
MKSSSGIVFTLQEVLVLTNRVRRLSGSFGALIFFIILLVLLAAGCFFGPWALLRKLPPRQELAAVSELQGQLDKVYADSQRMADAAPEIMNKRLDLSYSRLEWRMREAPNDPEAARLQQRPEELQRLLGERREKLDGDRAQNEDLQKQLRELTAQLRKEEARLAQEIGSSGAALESELRSFVETRRKIEEDKSLAEQDIEQLNVGIEEITEQIVRAGVPKEELANGQAYLDHLNKQTQQPKPQR